MTSSNSKEALKKKPHDNKEVKHMFITICKCCSSWLTDDAKNIETSIFCCLPENARLVV